MDKVMNLPGLAYSLYHDKNREVPMEFMDNAKDKESEKDSSMYGQLSKIDSMYFWIAGVVVFIVYLVLLYYAIKLALRVARSQGELILHVAFAVLNPVLYLFIALASQVWTFGAVGELVA
jgi:hypothetical protein